MKQLSSKATGMPASGIREIMNLAWQIDDAVLLMTGEPDFPTPPHVVEAIHKALDEGHTRYIASAGIPELRAAIAAKVQNRTGTPTEAANIVVTNGAMMSISTSLFCLLEGGDQVMLPDPGWPNYEMCSGLTDAEVVHYPLKIENHFLPDLAQLEELVSDRTKCIAICNPSNPTGQVYDRHLMEALAAFVEKHDLYLISDEIYEDIIFEGTHVSAAELIPERSIVISGFSKSYAMTGLRVGYMRAPEEIVRVLTKLQQPIISCGVAISQYGALAAITGPQDCVEEMRSAYRRRRDLAVALLKERGAYAYTPRGAFYIMVDITRSGMDGKAFALKLLQERHVAVAPGPTFGPGSGDFVRISLASSDEDIATGLNAICDLLP